MQDKLTDLLQQRFGGHEAPVDPGAWDAISSGLGTASGETLRQAMQQKFSGHEMNVDPGVWNSISSQMGHGAAAGTGIGAGWMAAGVSALVVTAGLLWYGSQGPVEEVANKPIAEQVVTTVPVTSQEATAPGIATNTNVQEPQVTEPAPVRNVPPGAVTPQPEPANGPSESEQGTASGTEKHGDEPTLTGPETVAAILQQEIEQVVASPVTAEPMIPGQIQPPTEDELPDEVVLNENATGSQTEPGTEVPSELLPDPSASEPTIWIPNIFTPNNDGVNERFKVEVFNIVPERTLVRVFSVRTAAMVFSSNSLDNSWEGLDLNKTPCEAGFYFYAIELTGADGHTYTKGATVRLNRQ